MTPEDAFKSFDVNFDGKVDRNDLVHSLKCFIKVPESELTSLRVDRLLKLLSFEKTECLNLNDFQRLLGIEI